MERDRNSGTSGSMKPCCALTKKKMPCSINADREREGKWYCHVHDPEGTYQGQLRGETMNKEQIIDKLLQGLRTCLLPASEWSCEYRVGVETSDVPGEICLIRKPNEGMTVTIKIDGGAVDTWVGP